MKYIKNFILLSTLMLCACAPISSSSSSESSSEPSSEPITSSSSSEKEEPPIGDYVFDFYNINDFHGHLAVEDTSSASTYCPGVSTLSANLNNFKDENPEGYVFTNSGDMFQETYEAYVTKGQAVSAVLNAMECEAFGVGNHEFDWGIEALMDNKEILGDCDLLGANVFYYDEKTDKVGTAALDLFDPYTIIERQGFNIGIIGIIGESQLTTITSSIWEGLTFIDPTDVVKDYAYELKEEHDCRIVIVLGHGSFNDFGGYYGMNDEITKEYKENTRYIDGMFLGHTHRRENKKLNGVPFIQSYGRGSQVSHFELTYNNGTGEVTCTEATNIDIDIDNNLKDEKIDNILNSYFDEQFYEQIDAPIGVFENGNKTVSRSASGRLQAYAGYEAIKDLYPDVVLVGNNGGRADVQIYSDYSVSKEMIFRMVPFTNNLCIAEVSGLDIKSNYGSGNSYYMPEDIEIENNKMYQVAIIDYQLLHKGTNRKYNYFTSFNGEYEEYKTYPCDLICDYFLEHGSIDADFLANGEQFSYLQN